MWNHHSFIALYILFFISLGRNLNETTQQPTTLIVRTYMVIVSDRIVYIFFTFFFHTNITRFISHPHTHSVLNMYSLIKALHPTHILQCFHVSFYHSYSLKLIVKLLINTIELAYLNQTLHLLPSLSTPLTTW